MDRRIMFFFLFFLPAYLTRAAQEPQLPSLDQITALPSDLSVDEQEQPASEPEHATFQPQTSHQISWKQWLTLHMQRITLTCVLKYYAIKAWFIRTT